MEDLQTKHTLKDSNEFQDFVMMKQKRAAHRKAKKFKQQRDHFGWKDIKQSVKNKVAFAKGAAKKLGHLAGATLLAPLLPFKGTMKKELEKKGFSTKGMDFVDVVSKFYNEVVSKKNNKKSHLEPIDEGAFRELPAFHQSYEEYLQEDHIIDDIIHLVTEIIGFFTKAKKTLQQVKSSGEDIKAVMTDTEIRAGEATERVSADLKRKERAEQPVTHAQMGMTGKKGGKIQPKHVAIGIGTLLIIIVAVIIFKNK